tara:strand:- start:237 stop:497 length:261 start_codon:yes stop_codon:yes gene_type:complete
MTHPAHPLAEQIREGIIQTIIQQAEDNGDSQHLQIIASACDAPLGYFTDVLTKILDSSMVARELDIDLFTPDEDCPWECPCSICQG